MKETSYTAKDWYAGRLAVPHGPKARKTYDTVATTWNGADLLRTTIGDYAKFVVSVMRDEGLTAAIAAERATITRDMVKPEDLEKACREAGEVGHCTVTAGMGLGWEVEIVNGVKILNHDGSDWGVKTFGHVGAVTRNRSNRFYQWRERDGGHQKSRGSPLPEPAIRGDDMRSTERVICETGHPRSWFERY